MLACGALVSELRAVLAANSLLDELDVAYLPANLHNRPERSCRPCARWWPSTPPLPHRAASCSATAIGHRRPARCVRRRAA
ncbi:MAG: hypothetical protein R2713_16690 [Ilumatobacteraceae bacterium]